MFYKQLRSISGTRFGWCWKKNCKVHVSSLWWCMRVQKAKVSTNKKHKKNCVQTLKLPSCVLLVFIIDINMYRGISKHSWKKIAQLLWTVVTYSSKKCWIWNWTWCCLWSLHRYIRHSLLNFTADLINTLRFKQIVNLTVC